VNRNGVDAAQTIHVSVREARMCVDRILLIAGVAPGYVAAVRECVLLSQALALGGFAHLLAVHAALEPGCLERIGIDERRDGALHIDAAGAHTWMLAPTLADLAVDLARKFGRAQVQVRRLAAGGELPILSEVVKRYGAHATVTSQHPSAAGEAWSEASVEVANAARPVSLERSNPLLHAALRHGFTVEGELWRTVHSVSNGALAPDSVVSRRHAGPVILQDDGTLLGRVPADDDFDVKMLKTIPATETGSRTCS